MKSKFSSPLFFLAVSGVLSFLMLYILILKTDFHPQLIIAACGEAIQDLNQYLGVGSSIVFSSLVIITSLISLGLVLWQIIRFGMSSHELKQAKLAATFPAKLEKIAHSHNLAQIIVLVESGSNLTAYTTGLIRPQIVLSTSLVQQLSDKQLEAVVLHELYHLQHKHVLFVFLSRLISALLFFVPIIDYLAQELRTQFEFSADAFVVEQQRTKRYLSDSLVLNLQYDAAVVPHFANSPIERRVDLLVSNQLNFKKITVKQVATSLLSVMFMLGIAIFPARQVSANYSLVSDAVCDLDKGCQSIDCVDDESKGTRNFTPASPISF